MSHERRIYSCDDHLDIFYLPADLWSSRVPSKLRDECPRVVDVDGVASWIAGDQNLGRHRATGHNAIARVPEIDDDGTRPADPVKRLQDMDRDDVWASVVYGPGAVLRFPVRDETVRNAMYRAWNDWAAEVFNAYASDRLMALAFLPHSSPDETVAELERCAALGHRGAVISHFGVGIGTPEWDKLWAASAALGLPISFHIGGGTSELQPKLQHWEQGAFATVIPMQLDEVLATMLFCGALERHPDCKIVLAESGIGWVPYVLQRADYEWEKWRSHSPFPATRPSELFARQMYITFEEEPLGSQLIPLVGADNVMWASDYPHPDSSFPNSRHAIATALGGLSDDDRWKVTGGNCQALYAIP